MGFRDMCPRPARSWCEGSSIRPLTPGHYPTLEEQQELGLRLRLRLREGLWSRESRCAAWARLHRACSARHLSHTTSTYNEDCYDKKNLTQHYRRLPGFSRTTSST